MVLNPVTNETNYSGYPTFYPLDDREINPMWHSSNLLDPMLPQCLEGEKKELPDEELPARPALFTRPSGKIQQSYSDHILGMKCSHSRWNTYHVWTQNSLESHWLL